MECPLGKLKPSTPSITGKSGRGRLKKSFNSVIMATLPKATTGTLIEYHLCFLISKK